MKRTILRLPVLLFVAATFLSGTAASARVWRVDCDPSPQIAAANNATIRSLDEVNSLALQPGDQILFRRGTVCHGALTPKGSGSDSLPVRIGAYGTGRRPRIEATDKDDAAFELHNQQYWEIDSLDITGSRRYGVHVVTKQSLLHEIVLRDLTVHGVRDVREKVRVKESGLVVFDAAAGAGFDDVTIDGILAYDTTQWAGILVSGATGSHNSHVVIRNSTVHDVEGDGIVLFRLSDGLIENSIAWHTGMQETESIGTPNAIWAWACTRCTVQNNEAFLTDSPGVDGGAFDIDYWNSKNSVLNNYAHDTQGYCVSVFGSLSPATVASVVHGNLCIRNGLSPRLAKRQGAIFLSTWDGGSIDGVSIERNTIYFDPPGNYTAVQATPELNARNVTFSQNALDSTARSAIADRFKNAFDNGTNEITHAGFSSTAVGDRSTATSPTWAKAFVDSSSTQIWNLIAAIPEINGGSMPRTVVGQLMLLRSQALQYGRGSLRITIACRCADEQRDAIEADWQLADAGIKLAELPADSPSTEVTVLVSPTNQVENAWEAPLAPTSLGLSLRKALGVPRFADLPAQGKL